MDYTGRKFGNWIISKKDTSRPGYWHCICSCGTMASIWLGNLKNGSSTGCVHCRGTKNKKHGKASAKIYDIWYGIKARCENPKHPGYVNYGAKGITLCDHWQTFENFYADMGDKPKGMSIDRRDSSKGYSPENCRWASITTQNRNKANNKLRFTDAMDIRYSDKPITELAAKFNIATPNIYAIQSGVTWKATTLPQMVAECHAKFGIPRNNKIGPLDSATWKFRETLIQEEFDELKSAVECNNLVDIADAGVDLLYVVTGTLLVMGFSVESIDSILDAIQAANMSKVRCLSGTESKRGNSVDLRKPDGWVGPESKIAEVIKKD